ncbi:type I polyketide synthase [Actinoplanes teichomyceticus]|uniref:Enediyne polyketide synthase n=1 Tax=Actinoplanes teichomyceticus TaxID=1867 RepID=A0A561WBU1_ACTTI|nr:type I polyketide synthase [Actinoplanes teichomyceticus]TWG21332.1 enediyne polyketide synthase [Actinoplanes teichomyceticus]GIF16417.1 polyketide synthase [Actinoplanes teichomyceticus]
MSRIAIVGMACRYPDATSPRELWENALAGRRAFRRLPDVRMRLDDYYDADPGTPDRFYARTAAVIEGYEFDRVGFRIAGSTYRATDLTHWLALDMAARALTDAGFPDGEGLPRERTGVVVGNTLTGEFSRAAQLRLRWPYVRRTTAAALREQGWDDERTAAFLDALETRYKQPFPPVDEDTLAGGLSNTIAGRICNYFDLNGGGYTVDGACSSSLLSVTTACRSLLAGELDVAVAGGVDLSIDPFEIIGFAKTGALAREEMRVYDRRSNGFWPGEGCGMAVLMREEDALAAGREVYATIAGWGVSSDGKGGITRPEADGYRLALRRAYDRAGFGIDTVALFEGHGTGTAVGDATELGALCAERAAADPHAAPAAIGSIKAMIGHTKAAAGMAGLIKAAMAVRHGVLPPTLGCPDPHELLQRDNAPLRALRSAEPWPPEQPIRAGVTAMGFGGINTHVVLDAARPHTPARFDSRTAALATSLQDAELLLVEADSPQNLGSRLTALREQAEIISYAGLADLAVNLHAQLSGRPYRAAVVASSPEEAVRRLSRVIDALAAGETRISGTGCFLGHVSTPGRLGLLFPGQGSGRGTSGGALRRRIAAAADVYTLAALPSTGDMVATAVAQPRIITGSLAGLRALDVLGLAASVAVGHSLGELAALGWAGVMDTATLLRVAGERGRTMAEHSASGTMASLAAGPDRAAALTAGLGVVVAGHNGPGQTVVAGAVDAVRQVVERARTAGVDARELAVSHAFHSPLVADAAGAFAARLTGERFGPLGKRVVSTVTGEPLTAGTDVPALLRRQITDPVLFAPALTLAAKDVDLFVEVGPGRVLTTLADSITEVPAVALDTDDESLRSLLTVAAAAYAIGAADRYPALFTDRLSRPLPDRPQFLASPCEAAPAIDLPAVPPPTPAAPDATGPAESTGETTVELLRRLAADRAELPVSLVHDTSLLLDDLHLSSITVGQIVNEASQLLGVPPAQAPAHFATASLSELADALDELTRTAPATTPAPAIDGAAPWVRAFAADPVDVPPAAPAPAGDGGRWQMYGDGADALRTALERTALPGGVLVCLPPRCTGAQLEPALLGAQAALRGPQDGRFVVVQDGQDAVALAKTLRLEAPWLPVTVLNLPDLPDAAERVAAEVAATTGYRERHYDADGTCRTPLLRALPVHAGREQPVLGPGDVLLVTGGGKGITAECALALAADSGAKLALIGRSDPAGDAELAANLDRMSARGLTVRYQQADVTDTASIARAVTAVTAELGPVTAILHGAGRNEPAALARLDLPTLQATLAPKEDGLRAVLAAVDPAALRLLVTFGSIIGRAGLHGEAHYATANHRLAQLTRELADRLPGCRTVCLEWSVWSGVGMGERLAVVETLTRQGIRAITPDQGVTILRRLLSDPDTPSVVVVTSRVDELDTLRYARRELPMLRFADRVLAHTPHVELICETDLNAGTDPYLADHELDGNLLFPAVLGLEGMAQVATALTGHTGLPTFEQAEFPRPIVVPPQGQTAIRIAATVTGDDTVQVAIRSAETGFAADHFRARLRWAEPPAQEPPANPGDATPVALDPARDLYGDTLFQGRRFQRLTRFLRAAAREVTAEVGVAGPDGWFSPYLPGELLLGDPGARDAFMHGNQVCVPDATLLPVAVDRLRPGRLGGSGPVRFHATERAQDGDTYIYDITVRALDGRVLERWEGLRLHAVRHRGAAGPWVPALLGSYLQRSAEQLTGASLAVAVEPGGTGDRAQRRAVTATALSRALGTPAQVRYRPDGRPEVDGGRTVSASHGAGVTLAVAGDGPLACDLEPVAARSDPDWRGLLGAHTALARLLAADLAEPLDVAATRVWTAIECLHKAGLEPHAPLTALPAGSAGWAVLASGDLRIASVVTTLRDVPGPVVAAVLTGGRTA